MKFTKYLIPAAIFLVLLIIVSIYIIRQAKDTLAGLPELYEVPEFSFTTQEGNLFTRSQMKGKINVVDFIFTSCPGICPVMSARMSELYQAFHGTDKVQFVSISVDPDRDSLETLKMYAGGYGVHDGRWIFLRAEIPRITDLYENGFKLSGTLPAEHSAKLILIDEKGIIRGYYDSQDEISMKTLKVHIKELAGRL